MFAKKKDLNKQFFNKGTASADIKVIQGETTE
jgi:hypothetical protein